MVRIGNCRGVTIRRDPPADLCSGICCLHWFGLGIRFCRDVVCGGMFGKVREAIRVWWRPLTCVGIAASVAVNGVALPLMNNQPVELMGWAAVITACATAFGVREWGKIKGADSNDL